MIECADECRVDRSGIFTCTQLSEFCSDFLDPRFLAAQFDHARSTGHIVEVSACSHDVLSNSSNANCKMPQILFAFDGLGSTSCEHAITSTMCPVDLAWSN